MTDTELRRLAENATPGPWEAVMDGGGPNIYPKGTKWPHGCASSMADAQYIAAASPDVVLGLLDRCERAEKDRAAAMEMHDAMASRVFDLEVEIAALEDRIKALEVELDEARDLMPWRSDVVAFHQLAERAPRCDAAEDLASWCMMILRAHAAKGGE